MESFSEIFQSEWIKVLWSKHKYCISLLGCLTGETFSKIHFHNNILQNVFPRGTLLNLLWHICFPYRWKLPIYKSVTAPIFHHLGQIAVERKEFPYAQPIIDDEIFEKWSQRNCQKIVASHIVGCEGEVLWIFGLYKLFVSLGGEFGGQGHFINWFIQQAFTMHAVRMSETQQLFSKFFQKWNIMTYD